MDFLLTFEEGQARLFEKVTSYPWQSQCRSRYQRRSKHLEKVTRCFHAWPLQDLSLRLISLARFRRDSRLTLKKVKSDCFRRSLPIRTSENINAKDTISPFWALRMSGLNLEKDTVLSSWTSGRPPDSVMDFRLTFEEGQAWLFVKLISYTWQSQCRSGHQKRSKHLEKAARCSHAWPLQNLSLRLISLVRFRLIPSFSEGYIPRIPPRSSTRRTITKKKHHWVFQSRSRMKNPEAAAASKQLARYWRCLVPVQATALGNHSETVFLRQVCFLNWRGPGGLGSGSVSTTDEPLMTSKRDRGESVGQSMRDRENLHKILEREAELSIQGENEAQKNYQRLKLMWKLEGGSKEVQKLLYMNPMENLKLKDYSFFTRIYGTMLKAKELVCVENWKWGTSSSKKVAQKIAKKLKNCEGVAVKRVTELDKQN